MPLSFELGDMYVDLAAEKIIAAQRDSEKIAVEIKSFVRASAISEFHTALGQFLKFRYNYSSSTTNTRQITQKPLLKRTK
jgi:XisH protein